VQLTHDFERDGVDDSLSKRLVGSVTLIDDVVLTLRNHNVHLRRRHEPTLRHTQPASKYYTRRWSDG